MYAESEKNIYQSEKILPEAEKNLMSKCNKEAFFRRFVKFFSRKEEWVLFYRSKHLTRNNNTNIFSEATIRILKDFILSRTRAFNVIAFCDFFIEMWENYFKTKLLDFAYSRRSSVDLIYQKTKKRSEAFTENDIIEVEDGFEIKSQDKTYTLKTDCWKSAP